MALTKLTKTQKAALAKFAERAAELQGLIDEVTDFIQEIRDEAQETFDERSEKWQESEKGSSYQEWIDALECDAQDLDELIEFLENVPEGPES